MGCRCRLVSTDRSWGWVPLPIPWRRRAQRPGALSSAPALIGSAGMCRLLPSGRRRHSFQIALCSERGFAGRAVRPAVMPGGIGKDWPVLISGFRRGTDSGLVRLCRAYHLSLRKAAYVSILPRISLRIQSFPIPPKGVSGRSSPAATTLSPPARIPACRVLCGDPGWSLATRKTPRVRGEAGSRVDAQRASRGALYA